MVRRVKTGLPGAERNSGKVSDTGNFASQIEGGQSYRGEGENTEL